MNPWYVLLFFLAVRISTVFLVQTWFVPDEYWQTVEVAHKIAFGYGYLTWEWTQGIRSYIYPALLASIFQILKFLNLDSRSAVIYGPRILQAFLSALGDYCFLKWYRNQNDGRGMWAAFILVTNWFWLYCGSRTLINTFETLLNTVALSLFPWTNIKSAKRSSNFLWFAGFSCIIRPTSVIIWLPLCIYDIMASQERFHMFLRDYVRTAVVLIAATIMLDSYFYNRIVFTPLEFLKTNIIEGINVFYGSHPFYWYITEGIPVVLGVHLLPFLFGVYKIIGTSENKIQIILISVIGWAVLLLSVVPHKEFRFLLPLMPFFIYIETNWLSCWSRKAHKAMIWGIAVLLVTSNAALLGYFGLIHQRGTMDVMNMLATTNSSKLNVLVLMPCHSTPLYSHIHRNISIKFLTCEPDFTGIPDYQDEADVFYKSPQEWLFKKYPSNISATHIIMYDNLYPQIKTFLKNYNYRLNKKFFHTYHASGRIGEYIKVFTN